MKRLHVHVSVKELDQSARFYSTLFAAEPSVRKADYAEWMLDDPRVNFAISTRGKAVGLDHLGIQVDSKDELRDTAGRLLNADRPVLAQEAITCCYARSDKAWVSDPQGVAWETFFAFGDSTVYGDGSVQAADLHPAEAAAGRITADACCARPSL
jgi:hypothetical protein